ncbi:hypothetical protein MARLIPOL_14925 [Marinobacter lipolyticus SM19]|uniref:HNH nuclease domain-containing protein n=1 Tax=Marinobacter lipolyticus SM19 TaxID=1318628 RepID=R8AXZ5_9GAMM|nr:hypothetical protein MARLIPOL_14925 [Marinobacter lipolyticus SM19]
MAGTLGGFLSLVEARKSADFQLVAKYRVYRVTNGQSEIELHPLWNKYIRANLAIIKGWALFQWADYLQRENPNIPALIKKIEPPVKRASLSEQTRFWNTVVVEQPIHCIYSGTLLQPSSFALDHFLPWSLVCHDELWNLIPADPRANSSKGRSLQRFNDSRHQRRWQDRHHKRGV